MQFIHYICYVGQDRTRGLCQNKEINKTEHGLNSTKQNKTQTKRPICLVYKKSHKTIQSGISCLT